MKRKLALLVAIVMLLTSINLVPIVSFAATTSVEPGVGTLASAVSSAYGGDTLTLSDGVYYVPSTITVGKDLTITATEGSNPIVVGGEQATGWSAYSGNIYRKAYTGSVTSIIEGTQAGKVATSGTYTVDSVSGNTISSSSIPSGLKTGYAKVITYGDQGANWQTTVNTITANSSGSLTFEGTTKRGVSAGTIFDLINDVSFIDQAGEFAYDGSYVYYYPYDASKLESEVSIATVGTIFAVNGNSTLTLRGLDIAGNTSGYYSNGDYVANYAVNVSGAAVIDGCDFYGIASSAVLYNGSATGLTVSNSTFTGIGGTAVYLYGNGALVTNNTMTNIGTEYSGGAVSIEGNNNTVSHNDISNCTRWGINLSAAGSSNGYGNILEYNDISSCNTKTSDSGLIYLYRMDGTTADKTNIIRYNAIHDSVCYNSMGFGIYLDDDADYTEVYGNWIYNLTYDKNGSGYLMAPIMIKGTGSQIHDNVIANNEITADYTSGAGNNDAVFVAQQLDGYTTTANKVYKNIVYNNNAAGNTTLFRVMDTESNTETFAYVDYNVYSGATTDYTMSTLGGIYDVASWRNQGFDANSMYSTNPGFADAANGNFAVTASIPTTHYQNSLTVDQIGVIDSSVELPTEDPTTEDPNVTEAPGTGSTGYIVDASVAAVQPSGDYRYNVNGATDTDDGYSLTAASGDFQARVWVSGCPIGNAANDGGVTVSFTAVLPETNAGRVYYVYSGEQNVEGSNPFVGFKPVDGGYRLLSNLSYEDSTDEYYNEKVYSGEVPVIVYITANQFELYVDGEMIATVPVTDIQLGSRWYYSFISYWAGNTATTLEITDLKYLTGKAIVSTAIVTDAPTAAPTEPSDEYAALFQEYNLGDYYLNGNNGSVSYDAGSGILTMDKSSAGSNFNVIIWSDSADSLTDTMTLMFDARVEGGYGHSWDGYAVSLRTDSGDYELVRLVAVDGGVAITKGAGAETLATVDGTGYHAYSLQYNKTDDTLKIIVDGVEQVSTALGFSGTQHGFLIKSGHNDATGAVLKIADFDLWTGAAVRYEATTVDPTEAPTDEPTDVPATEEPTDLPDGVTEEPAATDAPEGVELFQEYDLSGYYLNGNNGTVAYADGILSMTKDVAGSNFNVIIWSDSADSLTDTMTLVFDAKIGGYPGYINTWDGYAVSLRNSSGGDTELVRMVPTETGVAITKGAGAEVIATIEGTGYHAYSAQYNKADDTLTVYVDGEVVIDAVELGWAGATQHGFLIKNGHNDATGATLDIADFDLWTGAYVRTEPTTVGPTDAPTAEPTEAPGVEDLTGKVPVAGTAVSVNLYTNANITEADGAYTLDAAAGDASLYAWADAQVAALNEGKQVMISFTIDVPADNATASEEHGVQIAYMDRSQNGYGIYTFPSGGTYECALAILPSGDYIMVVDNVQVATGTLECTFADLWNICWRTYWAGGTDTTATVTGIASAEIAEWVVPEIVTEEPTEEPTDVPEDYTAAPALLTEYDLSSVYENGPNGTNAYADGILTMTKDLAGSNYNVIVWSDAADAITDVMTLMFDAKVEGGYGHSWDGYAVSLRTDSGDYELVRMVAVEGGVAITRGAGAETIATVDGTGYHAYTVQYDKANDTLVVLVDGVEVINEALGFTGQTQHGFMIKSGHNDATGAVLKIADMEVWTGVTVRTEPTTVEVTEAPTDEPTLEPGVTEAPEGVELFQEYDLSGYYLNGNNGTVAYADGILNMTKDVAGSNFNVIIWSDSADSLTDTMTLVFDAKVEGGLGHSWDGYAVSLRNSSGGDTELVRLVAVEGGVAITKGAGAETIATIEGTGYHAYSAQYNKADDTLTVYVDGEKVIDAVELGFAGATQHGFMIKSGHNDATGAVLDIADFDLWTGAYVRSEATTVGPTDAPTDVPTEAPGVEDLTGKVPVAGTAVSVNLYTNANITEADGAYTLDANAGDASLYAWADAQVAALNEGKQVMISFTIDVPADNATASEEHGVQIAYMDRSQNGYGIYTFPSGGTYECALAILPSGDYIMVVDNVQVATGTLECTFADLWNICWRTYWAGGTDTTATVTSIASAEIAEWVDAPEGTPTVAPEVTEEPAVTPAPGGAELLTEYDLSSVYENGPNGTNAYADGILTMTKDLAGSNYNVIVWSDAADAITDVMTLMFDAKVEGGLGHSWDGYAVSLRTDSGDYELVRMVAVEGGVAITRGAGAETIATVDGTGYHAYTVQYDKANDTLVVLVDGVEVINEALGFTGQTQHGFMIKSGHNDATGAVLKIADMEVWTGETVRTEPTTVEVTEAPTDEPTLEPGATTPPEGVELFQEYDLSGYYLNGANGTVEYVEEFDLLSMTKDVAGSNFNVIVWSDSADTITDQTMTLVFDAKVSGYPGYVNTWDGYAVSLRNSSGGDSELVRICPTETGVAITKGAGAEVLATVEGTGFHAYSAQYNKTADTLVIFVDGEQVAETTLGFGDATQHGFLIKNGHNDATGCELEIADFDLWTGAYVRSEATTVGPTEAPTEAPTEEPEYTTPDPSLYYVVDTEASAAQDLTTNSYNEGGVTMTDDGYVLNSNSTADFSARVWVNGCTLGNAANAGGLTVSFTAVLPETNDGRVYYSYAGDQGVAEINPFIGFKYNADENGYRLLSNLSYEDATDEYYNETVYTGEVDVMVYITSGRFEVYADGEYLATVELAEDATLLGNRWYYAFASYWGGANDTQMTITNLQYLTGDAVIVGEEPIVEGYTVSGTVALSSGTNGLSDATVTVMQNDVAVGEPVAVAADGSYTIEGLAAGEYTLVIARGAHKTTSVTITVEGDYNVGKVTLTAGDINNDGVIDVTDWNTVLSNMGTTLTSVDINSDGVIDVTDWNLVLSNFGK